MTDLGEVDLRANKKMKLPLLIITTVAVLLAFVFGYLIGQGAGSKREREEALVFNLKSYTHLYAVVLDGNLEKLRRDLSMVIYGTFHELKPVKGATLTTDEAAALDRAQAIIAANVTNFTNVDLNSIKR